MSLEFNKIAAASLVAVMVAMLSGIVAENTVERQKVDKDAYPIAVAAPVSAPVAAAEASDKPAPITAEQWATADPAKGEEIAKKCGQCHNFDKGGQNRIGPNLYAVVGRNRAAAPGFTYSDMIKSMGGNWTPEAIAEFIYKPAAYAPGTKMTFAGLPKAEERADVIAYLNKNSDSPIDLKTAK